MNWIRALYDHNTAPVGIPRIDKIPSKYLFDYKSAPMGIFPRNKKADNILRYGVSSIPGIGDLARFYDNSRAVNDYLKNRGISWEDVKYPSRLGTSMSNALGNMITQVPDAYQRLYDIDNPRQEYVQFRPEFHDEMPRASRRYYPANRLLR